MYQKADTNALNLQSKQSILYAIRSFKSIYVTGY